MARTPKLERAALDADGRQVWDSIASGRGGVPTSYRHLLASPGAAAAVAELGGYLRFGSAVDPRARELAVLVVNRETGCDFGWQQHVLLAAAMGISADTIKDLRDGVTPTGLTDAEALGVRTAQEICRNGSTSASTTTALQELWGVAGATDLVLAVGYYTMLAQYFLSMDLSVDPDELAHLTSGPDVGAAQAVRSAG